jgi:nucleoside-triphosphatase
MGRTPTQILLTGRPGVGKTTALVRTAELLAARGVPTAGFYTEELRRQGHRVGFRGVPLTAGEPCVIAHVDLPAPRIGPYGVDVGAIDRLSAGHLHSDPDRGVVVLIDEIGKMECLSPEFVRRVRALLDSPTPVLATVGRGGFDFMHEVRRRDDALLTTVTETNRDRIPERAARWLEDRFHTARR